MCGRYALTLTPEAARAYFGYAETPDFPPRANIAPTQPIAIVFARSHSGGADRRFLLVRWGFLPGFVKDPKTFPLLVNARAETVAEKPSYRAALMRRRCLVLADGYYVWRKDARADVAASPYLVRRIGGGATAFAGLYETWSDPGGGEIDTACIVTTAANALVGRIGDRMPAILEPADFPAWLDGDGVPVAAALRLLRPAPEAALELVAIGPAVNRAGNDGPGLQTPLAPPIRAGDADIAL